MGRTLVVVATVSVTVLQDETLVAVVELMLNVFALLGLAPPPPPQALPLQCVLLLALWSMVNTDVDRI